MADVNWSDDEAIDAFFGNSDDDDDDDDFEGFTEEDIQHVRRNIIENVPMSDFAPENDRDIAADLGAGWSRDDVDVVLAPFTGEPTLNIEMSGTLPIDFFKLFVDDAFLIELTIETNLYAQNKLNNPDLKLKDHSRMKKWQPVSIDEMKVFIALVIAMELVQKNDIQLYWSNDEADETPFFRNHMSRDRFLAILSNFHLTNNDLQVQRGQVGFDPLYKIRPFLNIVLDRFSDVYSPEKNLCFDEATCAWKGNQRFRVYNPAKPSKCGIKLYQVCEASSGYCIGFNIYTDNTGSSACVDYADTILGEENKCSTTTRIVLGLMARCGLLDKGHHVYMHNYYSSPELFTELHLQNTYACGTLRKNRLGVPYVIKKPTMKLKQSETIFRRNQNLLAVKYHDKQDVHMLSTIHKATVSVLDKVDCNTNQQVAKPTCIADYIAVMGGVDLSDQINHYSCLRKTSKWYKKLFFHLLNVCIINAYILFKKFGPNDGCKKEHQAFRMAVCESLLSEAVTAPRPYVERGRKSVGVKPTRLTDRHFPNYIPAKPGAKRARPLRECFACNVKKSLRETSQRKQTSFWCEECKVALCVPKCFQVYHTIQNYRGVLLPGEENSSPSDSE
ncbi:piggyBac transposable element-derived protein 4-like [Mizuhopecten yessoensis]|uniref:piggyBac transposable element-derived protein 4-like n=1 Tax=Mizuhopecten yessoensis TaxID=6573 RepID=UPI000B457F87|nr:piggyBac transposable element-derived protein 4-like [Mizuhopecten yessoensis]